MDNVDACNACNVAAVFTMAAPCRQELGPIKCRLAPTVRHTGQESGGKLCEIVSFRSFLPSKSVHNVCKLLQSPGPSNGLRP